MMCGLSMLTPVRTPLRPTFEMETKLKRIIGAIALLLLAFAVPASASDRLQIVASFSILGDMVHT